MRAGLERLPRALGACAVALALGTAALAPSTAAARGFVGVGVNLGFPIYPPPVVYAPPPAYYVPPPPIVYAPPPLPPPVYYAPQVAAPMAPGQQCREYQSTAIINGQPQQTVGTACLQPDGTWRIIK